MLGNGISVKQYKHWLAYELIEPELLEVEFDLGKRFLGFVWFRAVSMGSNAGQLLCFSTTARVLGRGLRGMFFIFVR
jgi:hypothetical protein